MVSISEITGVEGKVITMQELFIFDQRGVDKEGNVLGEMRATGVRPQCLEKIRVAGFNVEL